MSAARARLLAVVLATLSSTACGGGSAETVPGRTTSEPADEPIELSLRAPDGALIELGELRGRPTLLFLFATFDGTSQAAMRPLARFMRANPSVPVVGIAAQPGAGPLLDAWAAALQPGFTVAYDPEETVSQGISPLGALDGVPTFVMLDARGQIVDRHFGFASERVLDRMLFRATRGRRIPPAPEQQAPPLLGEPR